MSSSAGRCLAGIIVLTLAACSRSGSPEGTWLSENGEGRLEFLDKGEIYMTGPDGTYAGKWEIVDKGKVKITFGGRGAALGDQMCDFKIEDEALTLSGDCVIAGTYQERS